jgi:Co/Zn/Cd efflux system component
MSDCCSSKACQLDALRRRQTSTLKIVLLINAAMFLAEFAAGWAAGSVALVSDSLDMLGDALVYGFSLYAVTESLRTKAVAARIKGLIMAAFALAAFGQVVYRLLVPQVPAFEAMGAMGLIALLANGVCFALLWRHRADDINMSSVWLCSRNDLIANVSVVAAAGGVLLTRSGWPDMVVGIAIAALFTRSAITVLSESGRELRRADADHQATRSIPAGRSHD